MTSGADVTYSDEFHALLPVLARGLDVRETFTQLCVTAARIVAHDEAHVVVRTGDGRFHLYATTTRCDDPSWGDRVAAHGNAISARILDAVPWSHHLKSGLVVPVRINEEFFGILGLFSHRTAAYGERDVMHAQQLASYLALAFAHQRLAERSCDGARERERAASVEQSIELLRTIAAVLDPRVAPPHGGALDDALIDSAHIHARKLRAALQRAPGGATPRPAPSPETDLGAVESDTITRVLHETRWNKSKAARRLGLSRTQLYVRMRKYGLQEPPPLQS